MGTIAFPFQRCTHGQRWWWKNMRIHGTERTSQVGRTLLYFAVFSASELPSWEHFGRVMQLRPSCSWEYKVWLNGVCASLENTWIQQLIKSKIVLTIFLPLKCIHHIKGNTAAQLHGKAVPYWSDFQLFLRNDPSFGGFIPPSPRSHRWRAADSSVGPVRGLEQCCGSIWLQDTDECQEAEAHQPSGRLETEMGENHRSVSCLQACRLWCGEWRWLSREILTNGMTVQATETVLKNPE